MEQPPSEPEVNAPSELLEALAREFNLDPVDIKFPSCAKCPSGD